MLVRLMQATTITVVLYALLGINSLQTNATGDTEKPPEMIVALKQAIIRR